MLADSQQHLLTLLPFSQEPEHVELKPETARPSGFSQEPSTRVDVRQSDENAFSFLFNPRLTGVSAERH